jgi:tRNA(Ile)-lysidine synthase
MKPVEVLRAFLEGHAIALDACLVAYSAGADSTALLAAAAELSNGGTPRACWIDHGIRPRAELDEEAAFAAATARGLGVEFHTRRADPGRLEAEARRWGGVEAAARAFRYAALRELKAALGLRWILTAHHAEDNAETILMRLFSASGTGGLRGMAPVAGDLARPFLGLTKGDLLAYLDARGLGYRDDSTNASGLYLRNRIRSRLTPVLAEVFPSYLNALDSLAEKAAADDEALVSWAKSLIRGGAVPSSPYRAAPQAVRLRAIFLLGDAALAARSEGGLTEARIPWRFAQDIDRKILALGDAAGFSAPRRLGAWSGIAFSLTDGVIRAAPDEGSRVAAGQAPAEGYALAIRGPGEYRIGTHGNCTVYWREGASGPKEGSFRWPLVIRSRRPGDRLATALGSKSPDELVAEQGLPASVRDRVPVLEDPDGLVAVLASAYGGLDRYRRRELNSRADRALAIELKGVF